MFYIALMDVYVNARLNELYVNDIFVEQYLYYRSNHSNQRYIQSHTIHSHYYTLHTFQSMSPNSRGQSIHAGKLYQQEIIITSINQKNMWVLYNIFHIHVCFIMHIYWKLCWLTCVHTSFTVIPLITGSTSR